MSLWARNYFSFAILLMYSFDLYCKVCSPNHLQSVTPYSVNFVNLVFALEIVSTPSCNGMVDLFHIDMVFSVSDWCNYSLTIYTMHVSDTFLILCSLNNLFIPDVICFVKYKHIYWDEQNNILRCSRKKSLKCWSSKITYMEMTIIVCISPSIA